MPASKLQLKALTGLRYFAALAVLLFHYGHLPNTPWILFVFGRQAVALFFILSGFVLTYAYGDAVLTREIRWKTFMNRRLARLVPMHLASLALATVVYWKVESRPMAVSWLADLLCVQVYWPSTTIALHWNAPSWSISCELFFYALFPALLVLFVRNLRSTGALFGAIAGIYGLELLSYFAAAKYISDRIATHGSFLGFTEISRALNNILPLTPAIRLGEFCVGICLGLLMIQSSDAIWRRSKTLRNAFALAALAGAVILQRIDLSEFGAIAAGMKDYLLFVPFWALLIWVLASGGTLFSKTLENRLVVLLGESSYSLYLLHYPLGAVLLGNRTPARYVIAFLCANGLAVAGFLYVERPLISAWQKRVGRAPKEPALEQSQF